MSRSHERALAGENRRYADLTDQQKRKLRALIDDFFIAQAMHKAAYERNKECAQDLILAQRGHQTLTSARQRHAWLSAENRGSHAPGTTRYDDAVAKSARKVDVAKLRAERAAASLKQSEKAEKMLARPLEQIASHFRLDRLGFEARPVEALERICI